MRKGHTFRIPNCLILDGTLSFSARRMGAVLYSRRNALGTCHKSLQELASFAQCSVSTARAALTELVAHGYITSRKVYRYDVGLGRTVYAKTAYTCVLGLSVGFTMVPRAVFTHRVRPSSFLVLLYLYFQAGNDRRAFPSLSKISADLDMARSTVCHSLRELGHARLVYAQACIKANRAHSFNSYYFLCQTTGAAVRLHPAHPLRPRAHRRAVERLGVLLALRYAPPHPGLSCFPYISFCPLPLRWKPPFTWGVVRFSATVVKT